MNFRRSRQKWKLDIEPYEILLDNLARKKEEEIGISEKRFEVPLQRGILLSFYFIFCLTFALLFGRVFFFQVLQAKEITQLAKENVNRTYLFQSPRGVIYDSSGDQLVFNEYSFDLVADKRDLPIASVDRERVLREVAEIINIDFEQIKEDIYLPPDNRVLVSKNLSHEMLLALETKINNEKLSGFEIEQSTIRRYKDSQSFSHLIGYMGKVSREEYQNLTNYSITDYIGKLGIEKSYESVLRGNPGVLVVEKDAKGEKKFETILAEPEPGKSLVLWLDSDLQKKIEEELSLALNRVGGKRGVAIAMNPKTGGILAMVSLPSFDNNVFSSGSSSQAINDLLQNPIQPLFNRAISGKYLTGSTIKPLISIAALEENIISPDKKIYSPGFIEVPHRYDPEIVYRFLDQAPPNWYDMRRAIAFSSNVYFYAVGGGYGDQTGLGPTKIKKYLELFGWNQKTGIDMPGESIGFIPDPEWKKNILKESWLDGDTYYLSIGQQYLQITPLEVVNSFAAIANGGTLYEPRVVKEIIDSSDGSEKVFEEIKPSVIRENFVDQKNIQIVREGMRQAVTSGTASAFLNNLPVTSAVKTGTAELGNDRYNTWFSVFAPYEDPEIVMTIVIENIGTLQATVWPVAKEVLNWYFSSPDAS